MRLHTDAKGGQTWYLTLEDKVRLNALIQRRIQIDAFKQWYAQLDQNQRVALSRTLFDIFICEQHNSAGKEVVLKALDLAGRKPNDPLVIGLLDLVGGFDPNSGFKSEFPSCHSEKVSQWIRSHAESDQHSIFELCVYFFGVHEGIRFEACAGQCSHWWHQDLNDPKIVARILGQSS